MAEESKKTNQVDEKTTIKKVKGSSVKKPRISSSSKTSEAKKEELKEKTSTSPKTKELSSKTDENFNWDELTNNEIYSKDERLDLEKTYTSTLPNVIAKQVIDGKVVRVWNDMEENKMYTVNDDIFVSSLLMWGDLESVI